MSLWGTTDNAANSVLSAPAQVNKTPNTANRDALFGNTTANAYFAGVTVGQYGVSAGEAAAERADGEGRVTHAGWVLRTVGQGGRAGRVFHETLVAMGSITSDASDDAAVQDYTITVATQPANDSASASNNEIATFTVLGTTTPAGGTVTYQWQAYNGSAFANLSNAGAYSNTTTGTLSVLANTASNGEIYRAVLSVTGGNTVNSGNAVLTVTA